MTADELVLMEIKSLIFDMPPDGQKLVEQAMNELEDVLKKYPEGHDISQWLWLPHKLIELKNGKENPSAY
jgi:hypothetical protein